MRAVISNGGDKFHLAPLAAEIAAAGKLAGFFTAGYPTGWQKRLAERFPGSPGWRRFLNRAEPIPAELVHSLYASELFLQVAALLFRNRSDCLEQWVQGLGYRYYARSAGRRLRNIRPDIYHYRNCYGLNSVEVAKGLGAIALCDHSIAHPVCLQWMVNHQGQCPDREQLPAIRPRLMPQLRLMEKDIKLADHTLVNSHFVKQTCVHAGMDGSRVHVAYWGVDEAFFNCLLLADVPCRAPKEALLFAGEWQLRKGVATLRSALNQIQIPWKLDIAGNIFREAKNQSDADGFFSDLRVKRLGKLPRQALARLMMSHRLFVFPSYCEGSARVIFEALAAGCYVITTPNAGSIVENGVHGRLVRTGDTASLRDAIEEALANTPRVEAIGRRNAQVVAQNYRQRHYGSNVQQIYDKLLNERRQNSGDSVPINSAACRRCEQSD